MSTGVMILKRSVKIESRLPSNDYYKKNFDKIILPSRFLGSTIGSVNKMLANTAISLNVMPSIIGVSPTDNRWFNHIRSYWDGMTTIISPSGRVINTSLIFINEEQHDAFNVAYNKIIETYAKSVTSTPADESKYFKAKIEDLSDLEDIFLSKSINNKSVMTVENPEEYIVYRHALISSDVANRESDVNNSAKIRFYISDESERKRVRDAQHELSSKATKRMVEVMIDENLTKFVVVAMRDKLSETYPIKGWDKSDYGVKLMEYSTGHSALFISVSKDEDLKYQYLIIDYIDKGILRRLVNSTVLVDSATNDIIGNTMFEAVLFFKEEEKNKVILSKYKAQFATVNKK